VEYGSSLEASRSFGVFRTLYDLVYNLNLAHLNPEAETIFERLEDVGTRTAAPRFLIYRGAIATRFPSMASCAARRCDPSEVPTPHLGPARALLTATSMPAARYRAGPPRFRAAAMVIPASCSRSWQGGTSSISSLLAA